MDILLHITDCSLHQSPPLYSRTHRTFQSSKAITSLFISMMAMNMLAIMTMHGDDND